MIGILDGTLGGSLESLCPLEKIRISKYTNITAVTAAMIDLIFRDPSVLIATSIVLECDTYQILFKSRQKKKEGAEKPTGCDEFESRQHS